MQSIIVPQFFDTGKYQRIPLRDPKNICMTIGLKIPYGEKEIEITQAVYYWKGYTGKKTPGVRCFVNAHI